MFGIKRATVAVSMVLVTSPLSSVRAEDAKSGDETEKAAVVKELLDASRVTRNAQMGFNMVMDQELKGLNAGLANAIDQDSKLTKEEKVSKKQELTAKIDKRLQRFKQLSEEKIQLPRLTTDVYVKLYEKYFSLQELKDMVAWYKSPTGQHTLDVLPQLSAEAMQMINANLMPKMRDVSQQLELEEKDGKI